VHVINTSICTCCTSLVIRVISDGAPKTADITAESHRHFRAEIDSGDRQNHLRQSHEEHDATHPPDVPDVVLYDALIDDVGVQRGQEEPCQGLNRLKPNNHPQQTPILREDRGQEALQHEGSTVPLGVSHPRSERNSLACAFMYPKYN
jgi:hypothetical protein